MERDGRDGRDGNNFFGFISMTEVPGIKLPGLFVWGVRTGVF